MSFVLDRSATLPWIFADEAAEATDQLLDTLQNGAQAWVPALWHLELANVLIGAQRRECYTHQVKTKQLEVR